jgi:hypothetical protein
VYTTTKTKVESRAGTKGGAREESRVGVLTGDGGAAVALGDALEGVRRRELVRRLEQVGEACLQLWCAHR